MADEQTETPVPSEQSGNVGTVRNCGEPIRFENVETLGGFAAEPAKNGQHVKVWTRLNLTSDEPLFHQLADNFARFVSNIAQKSGTFANIRRAHTVLFVLKPNSTAELWLDTAAVSLQCAVKRAVTAGTVVFENDIVDVTGMSFPCVEFGDADKVLCLFRQDWRFGFAFDMNPEGKLDIEKFTSSLGTLYRELRYRPLYDALSEQAVFNQLLAAGWFPFSEIITAEFNTLLQHIESGFDLADIENNIVAKFDDARMQHILKRWVAKPHFASRTALLEAAISAFCKKEPIPTLKILLTEIEGVLNDAYRTAFDKGAKLKDLLVFAETSAMHKSGGENTLLFPEAFGRYLREYTFAKFDPVAQTGTAGSRHAVGHGAASPQSYTMTRALQAILTLDQLAFYT